MFQNLERFTDRIAVIDSSGDTWTYGRLLAEADQFASSLDSRSVIFLLCSNDMPTLLAYVGCIRKRVVPLLLGANIQPSQLESLRNQYQPEYVWGKSESLRNLDFADADFSESGYSLLRSKSDCAALDPELGQLMTTSGSTGSPLLVRQTYRNVESNLGSISRSLGMIESDRAITTLPFNYTYGLSIINSHLHIGASVVLNARPITHRDFWRVLEASKASNFGGVPYTFEILRRFGFEFLGNGSVRYLTQAGGRLRPEWVTEVATASAEAEVGFFVMYGQTEASPRMSVLSRDEAINRPDSIGRAIPDGTFWIEDGHGEVNERPGKPGELVYSGPNVAHGYARTRADLAKGDEFGGVLRTGDIATVDESGYYRIVGRTNRFIKLFGNRVNLEDIERCLQREGIEAACKGSDDSLEVYVTDQFQGVRARDVISTSISIHPSAIAVVVVGELPRAESGKVLYSRLGEVGQ